MIGSGTIAAIASPPGRAPRTVLRLSGPDARTVIDRLAGLPFRRGVHRARLALAGLRIPSIIILYPAPNSYTGEDSAEIFFAGSHHLGRLLTDAVLEVPGVRAAGPGEFTARAYVAGRLTLEEAEGVAAIISATGTDEANAARRLLSGEAGDEARAWVEEVAMLLALVEAGVDFTDQEDVVPIAAAELSDRLSAMRRAVAARTAGPSIEPDPDGALVVLAGAPNAGKTTLFNAMLGRDRGVVSASPGSTRDLLVETVEIRGAQIRLADAPGFQSVSAEIETLSQGQAQRAAAAAALVIHCDPSGRFDVIPGDGRVLRVRTKADIPGSATASDVAVCALDGWNLGVLREAIADAVIGAADATPRRRRAMLGAIAGIDQALATLREAGDEREISEPELVAASLRAALDALGELAGAVPPDEIIGRVFAAFCVGK